MLARVQAHLSPIHFTAAAQVMYPLRGEGNEDAAKGQDLMVPSLLPENCVEHQFDEVWPAANQLLKEFGVFPPNPAESCPLTIQSLGLVGSNVELRAFARRYEVEFVPLGVFSRLLVRALHKPGSSLRIPWRFGFVINQVSFLGFILGHSSCMLPTFLSIRTS